MSFYLLRAELPDSEMRRRLPSGKLLRRRLNPVFPWPSILEIPELDTGARDRLITIRAELPSKLGSIAIFPNYGAHDEIAEKVIQGLMTHLGLERLIVERALLGNLRTWMLDVSRAPGYWVGMADLESEVGSAYPQRIKAVEPRPLPPRFVPRQELVDSILSTQSRVKLISAPSATGKTTFASEIIAHIRRHPTLGHPFYVELRQDVSLRDALAGVAYRVRALGFQEPFNRIVHPGIDEHSRLQSSIDALSRCSSHIHVFLDFVTRDDIEGDLAAIIRCTPVDGLLTLWVIFTENPLVTMLPAEQSTATVTSIHLRGFTREEFGELAKLYGRNPSPDVLAQVFQRLGANRESGVRAKVAELACASDTGEWPESVVQMSPEHWISKIDRQRLKKLSQDEYDGAIRLLTHFLPFYVNEAAMEWPDFNIRGACRSLLELGLLVRLDDGALEFHETTRVGLLQEVPPAILKEAHTHRADVLHRKGYLVLAAWHHEQAGSRLRAQEMIVGAFWTAEAANRVARLAVSRGWIMVDPLVTSVLAAPAECPSGWWMALENLASQKEGNRLLDSLSKDAPNCRWDFNSFRVAFRLVLTLKPSHLEAIISKIWAFEGKTRESAKTALRFSLRDLKGVVDLDRHLYSSWRRSLDRQPELAPIFASHPTSKILAELVDWERHGFRGDDVIYDLDTSSALSLLSLLRVDLASLLDADAGLRQFAPIVFRHRDHLLRAAKWVIDNGDSKPDLVLSAAAVLVFLSQEDYAEQIYAWSQIQGVHQVFCFLALAFLRTPHSTERYLGILYDPSSDSAFRCLAALAAAILGNRPSQILAKLSTRDEERGIVRLLMTILPMYLPDSALASEIATLALQTEKPQLVSATVLALALAATHSDPNAENVAMAVVTLLGSEDQTIRFAATMALAKLRQHQTVMALQMAASTERVPELRCQMLLAAAACGASASSIINTLRSDSTSTAKYFAVVLASRTRMTDSASWVLDVAMDKTQHWSIRRDAWFALGRLPWIPAIEGAVRGLLSSPSLVADTFYGAVHSLLTDPVTLASSEQGFPWELDEPRFVELIVKLYATRHGDGVARGVVEAVRDTARVVWQRANALRASGLTSSAATVALTDELCDPLVKAAALRTLRIHEKPEIIEEAVCGFDQWLTYRAALELVQCRHWDPEATKRLVRQGANASSTAFVQLIDRVVDLYSSRKRASIIKKPSDEPIIAPLPLPTIVDFRTAMRLAQEGSDDIPQNVTYYGFDAGEIRLLGEELRPSRDRVTILLDRETGDQGFRWDPNGPSVARRRQASKLPYGRARLRSLLRATWLAEFGMTATPDWFHLSEVSHRDLLRILEVVPKMASSEGRKRCLEWLTPAIVRHLATRRAGGFNLALLISCFDATLVPWVTRLTQVSPLAGLVQIARLACNLNEPSVDSLLDALVRRIGGWITAARRLADRDLSVDSLVALARHPRVHQRPRFGVLMEEAIIAESRVREVQRVELLRALEGHAGCWLILETHWSKMRDWIPAGMDVVSIGEQIADDLFSMVSTKNVSQ